MLHKFQNIKINSDLLGISSSLLCLIHCTALPIAYVLLAKTSQHIEWLHQLDFIFIGLGFIAVLQTAKSTPLKWIKVLLWFFFTLFSISILFEDNAWMEAMSYVGSIGLISAHALNFIRSH